MTEIEAERKRFRDAIQKRIDGKNRQIIDLEQQIVGLRLASCELAEPEDEEEEDDE